MSALMEQHENETLPTSANHDAYMMFPRFPLSGRPLLKDGCINEACKAFECQPSANQHLLQSANSCPNEKHDPSSCGIVEKAMPNALSGPAQKTFLLFDRTGNQTRLILNPTFYHTQKPTAAFTNPVQAGELRHEDLAANSVQMYLMKSVHNEKIDENHTIDEESEMHEDTEEINALLYSDDDDDYDDDEETSTGHSPFGTEDRDEKQEQIGVMAEEVATSDVPAKRLKLLDGGYGKSSLDHANSIKPVESFNYDDDAESSYTKGRARGADPASVLGRKRSRQDKISNTLEILENLIPGGKGKNPLVVLDEAINYLISLKLKAISQGDFAL